MAHPEDVGDLVHRQVVLVGRSNRLVAVLAELLTGCLQALFALSMSLCEFLKASAGCGR
jgi:hypothetical protein